MMSNRSFLGIYCAFLLLPTQFFVSAYACDCDLEKEQEKPLGEASRTYQNDTLDVLQTVFDHDQPCAPCDEQEVQQELKETKAKLQRSERNFQALAEAMLTPANQKRAAHVPLPSQINGSAQFSCDSRGQPVNLCIWERKTIGGHPKVVVVDQEVAQQGGWTSIEGVEYFGAGLGAGECGLKISSITENDLGKWGCTLVTHDGQVFTGTVNVADKETLVYFATRRSGIKAYSPKTAQVTTVVNTTEDVHGVTYDTVSDHLYWTSTFSSNGFSHIYRCKVEGERQMEMLLNTSQYGIVRAMEFDWIANNLYVVTSKGYILACDCRANQPFRCAAVMTGQGDLAGIALNPNGGTMYWTAWTHSGASIFKSGMDGSGPSVFKTGTKDSSPSVFVANLTNPCGLVIDFHSARLYWADREANKIQSSRLDGGGVVTIAELSSGPCGIALAYGRLYWGLARAGRLQSGNTDGGDIRTVYTGNARIRHLTAPDWTPPRNRTNPCREEICSSSICVLTATSYRCLQLMP